MTTGTSAGKSLVRATLSIHEPPTGLSTKPGGLIATVELQFNPSELELTRRAQWRTTPTAAVRDSAVPEFLGPEPRSLQLRIFLDCSDKPGSTRVLKQVERLFSCCETTAASIAAKQPSTPWVVFRWGNFSTVSFTAYVSSVEAGYNLFSPTGVPMRATCDLLLEEIPSKSAGQNPTSGALTVQRVHRVVAGDTLPSLAWREYGDSTVWRAIAELNDIDDPMQLSPGRELLLPAADEVR